MQNKWNKFVSHSFKGYKQTTRRNIMRRKRVKVPKGRYHITSRINNKENFLEDDEVKAMFLEVLTRAKKKYRFVIYNLCIMNNHVHYMLKPGKNSDLSKIVQWINSVFAMGYNVSYDHSGHVWGERFHSTLIGDIIQFLRTFFYIADNPVKAELVANGADYPYNGIAYILKGDFSLIQEPDPLFMEMILNHI